MKTIKSRKKITAIAIALAAFALVCWDFSNPNKASVDKSTFRLESEFDPITVPTTPTKVAIVTSDYADLADPVARTTKPSYEQIEGMVRKAIELQGGFDGVIEAGDKVMIKVNLVGGNSPSGQGENTDVNVVKALIKTIYDFESTADIMVAEGTARTNDDPTVSGSVWHNSGYVPLLTDSYLNGINLSLVNLNQSISELTEIDLGSKKGTASTHDFKYHIHKKEAEADVYISVPVLKMHSPGLTAGLKNQIGSAPGCYYGYNKSSGKEKDGNSTPKKLHAGKDDQDWSEEEIVDLSNCAGIDFVVIDAIMTLQIAKSYKPERQLRMNTIIAGKDPVAVDNVSARVFGVNPDDIVHITLAEKVGLGTNNPDHIEIVGASIESTMKRAKKSTKYGASNRTWLLSPAFSGSTITEEYIDNEKDYIPEVGVDGWSEAVYFFDDDLDLYSYYDGATGIATYAFTNFYSPDDTDAELWIGRQEPMYVYINNELVYSKTTNEDFSGRKEATVSLKEGENTLMVKTLNMFGSYTFALNICEVESNSSYAGNRLPGLKFYTDTFTIPDPIDPEPVDTTTNSLSTLNANEISLSNYPNPFTDFTTVKFSLAKSDITTINVYNLDGKLIENLATTYYSAGTHEINWDASMLNPGYYICTIHAGNYSESIKLIAK